MFLESRCDEYADWMDDQMIYYVKHRAKLEGNRLGECCIRYRLPYMRMGLCPCRTCPTLISSIQFHSQVDLLLETTWFKSI